MPAATLPGPVRTIVVEPVELPREAPQPQPTAPPPPRPVEEPARG